MQSILENKFLFKTAKIERNDEQRNETRMQLKTSKRYQNKRKQAKTNKNKRKQAKTSKKKIKKKIKIII
jgi:hypothetical protein